MRATFAPGQVGAGWLLLPLGRTPPNFYAARVGAGEDFRDLYWRELVRTGPGWTGAPHKQSRVYSVARRDAGGWPQAMIAHVWTGPSAPELVLDPARGVDAEGRVVTTTYNDFAPAWNVRWRDELVVSTRRIGCGPPG